ncbi:MAG: DUF1287 domain-containing protein [Chryseolinea sp.]
MRIVVLILFVWVSSLRLAGQSAPATSVDFYTRLATVAVTLTHDEVVYDPSYFRIPYPNGDVPPGKGVCTDVVIRAYRKLNIDLQQLVHEDMKANFDVYPKRWGMRTTEHKY